MNLDQLKIMKEGKGFIAALDQSGGSTPRTLRNYGVPDETYFTKEEMFNLIHHMRTRIITSKSFNSKKILGSILFENTMDRKVEGLFTPDYLWKKKGIVPFLKIDRGMQEEKDGVRMFRTMNDLDSLLIRAKERSVFGTKERTVIESANMTGINALVKEQFDIGKKVASYGLVPIIEPEVTITIPDKQRAEAILKEEIKSNLAQLPETVKVILKLSLPSIDGFYNDIADDPHIIRIAALSGGYSQQESNRLLKRNTKMIASFSRALTQGLKVNQTSAEFEETLSKSIDSIYDASVNKD